MEFKTNVLRLRRELGIYAGGQHYIVAHPGTYTLQMAAETCECSQVQPLSMYIILSFIN